MEAITFLMAEACSDCRLYLGHEKLLVYVAAGIVAVNFVVKNGLLIVWGIDLLSGA